MDALDPRRLAQLIADRRVQVIDMRPARDWRRGHIPGSRNIELDALPQEVLTLDRELPLVLCDDGGEQAAEVAEAMHAAGMTTYVLAGGFGAWNEAGQPVERAAEEPG